jgi:hypothetical protein
MISHIRETRTYSPLVWGGSPSSTAPLLNSCMRTYEILPHMTTNEKTMAMAEIMAAWTRAITHREAARC